MTSFSVDILGSPEQEQAQSQSIHAPALARKIRKRSWALVQETMERAADAAQARAGIGLPCAGQGLGGGGALYASANTVGRGTVAANNLHLCREIRRRLDHAAGQADQRTGRRLIDRCPGLCRVPGDG